MAKKNKIEVKLIRGNNINSQTPPDMVKYRELVAKGSKAEEEVKPALLISRVDHPVTVKYGESSIRLSPRCVTKVGDVEKLEKKLPSGVFVKQIARVQDLKED